MKIKTVKIAVTAIFLAAAIVFALSRNGIEKTAEAASTGPAPGFSGAPGETTCANCHFPNPGNGQFTIVAPPNYTPGQTYQITVRHQTTDTTRRRWGFQMTALAGATPTVQFAPINAFTQVVDGAAGRKYIEHTLTGSFGNQQGGAFWSFNWTAPPTNVGPVTFYAAGNEANNDGTFDGDQIYSTAATVPPVAAPTRRTRFDFDGDGKVDLGIFRPAPAEWWYQRSSDAGNRASQFGATTDKIVPGDFTGDGKTDIAIWRPSGGEWFILRSEDNSFYAVPFGATGDVPIVGDFDADGKDDIGVFRPSILTWFISLSSGGTTILTFGATGDVPVVADYDGDGKADIAVFRPAAGEWWIQRSTAGLLAFQFGAGTDKATPGDYTGDGKADAAFFRPSTGDWFVLRSEDSSFFSVPFGAAGDIPVAGDYDGDGKTDFAIFRPASSTWFANRTTGGVLIAGFGATGDAPVPAAFVP